VEEGGGGRRGRECVCVDVYVCAYLPDVELLDALGVDPLHYFMLKRAVYVYMYMYGGNVWEGVK
jgi:hypothetical protein